MDNLTDDEAQRVYDRATDLGNEIFPHFSGHQAGIIMMAVGSALAWFAEDSGISLENVLEHVSKCARAERMSDPKRQYS